MGEPIKQTPCHVSGTLSNENCLFYNFYFQYIFFKEKMFEEFGDIFRIESDVESLWVAGNSPKLVRRQPVLPAEATNQGAGSQTRRPMAALDKLERKCSCIKWSWSSDRQLAETVKLENMKRETSENKFSPQLIISSRKSLLSLDFQLTNTDAYTSGPRRPGGGRFASFSSRSSLVLPLEERPALFVCSRADCQIPAQAEGNIASCTHICNGRACLAAFKIHMIFLM